MNGTQMRRYWDERAREDAFHFVDNRRPYGDVDEESFWAGGETTVDALFDELGVAVGGSDTVLEIGCGVGRLTRVLAGRARHVIGVDVSEEMLGLARSHHPDHENIEWLLGDGTSLAGVPDSGVDACLSTVVFQHIPDPAITLGYVRELGRVMRPGAWAALQVSNDPSVHRPRRAPQRFLMWARSVVGRAPRGQQHPAWLGSAVDLEEFGKTATASGLEVEKMLYPGTQYCIVLLRRPA